MGWMEIRGPRHKTKLWMLVLYYDHVNVSISTNLFNKYLQENTHRDGSFLRVSFSYHLLTSYDPHLLPDEGQEMP